MKKILLTTFLILNISVESQDYIVKMLNQGSEGFMVFEPAVLKILPGDSVTFEATDAAHNSASISDMIPPGAKGWNGDLSKDITVTFDIEGVYVYQCAPHAIMAMVGIIEVGNNQNNLENIKTIAGATKSTFVMNADRLDNYISSL
jgi:pseudoazurin